MTMRSRSATCGSLALVTAFLASCTRPADHPPTEGSAAPPGDGNRPRGEPAGGSPRELTLDAQQREIQSLEGTGRRDRWSFSFGPSGVSRFQLRRITGGIREVPSGSRGPSLHDLRPQNIAPPGKEGDTSFDWRSARNVVTPVQNQGDCPVCWAFTANAMLESAYAIARQTSAASSEQQLVDCVPDPGCVANRLSEPSEYAVGTGDASRTDVPYAGQQQACRHAPVQYKGTATSFVDPVHDTASVQDIKHALVTAGPVGSYIEATDALKYYRGGVFDEFASTGEGHFVLIIGWDDSKVHRRGHGAWLVKNSWGTSWGEAGFGWIAYESNSIGAAARWLTIR
jgi:hypothetical protein